MNKKYEFDFELIDLGDYKQQNDITWENIADIINDKYNVQHSESFYRKRYKYLLDEEVVTDSEVNKNDSVCCNSSCECSNISSISNTDESDLLRKIKIEKVKLSDERIQNNAYIRALAREETLKEIAKQAVEQMSNSKILELPDCIQENIGFNEAILVISDWHYGIICNNSWNKYDPDIAVQRLIKLKYETIRHCQENNVSKLYVINLSDLICGRIHLPLRLESRFDVITQTMRVSEILAEFLNDLSSYYKIEYYDCEDNHSRVEPNKANSLHLENFTRVIKWYLKSRLENNYRIIIHENNTFSDDIITFTCNGFNFAAVHGDKDRMSNVVESISLMTKQHFDVILTAHLHHFAADEINETVVIQNGSLVGPDTFATSIRKTAVPSQILLVVSKNNPTEAIYRIILK